MAEAKQSGLNGAYYGPSIPPKTSYHRHGRGRGCLCGPCCLLCLLLKLIFSIVIVVGIVVLVGWVVLRPSMVKFHVVNASLKEFDLTNNTLRYNLALNMAIRNPNKKIGIQYDRIEARAYYKNELFDTVFMTPFYQDHKNTTMLNPVFQAESVLILGGTEALAYNRDKNNGNYDVDVKLYLRTRFKVGGIKVKTNRFRPKVKCSLRIPLGSNGAFGTKKCDIGY